MKTMMILTFNSPVNSDCHHIHKAGGNVAIKEERKDSAQLWSQGPLLVHISGNQHEDGDEDDEDVVPGRCEGEVDGTEEKIRNSQTDFEIEMLQALTGKFSM